MSKRAVDIGNADINGNISLNSSINVTLTPSKFMTSTPFKKPNARAKTGKKKAFVRPVCDTCNVCGQEYRCHRSYVNHMRKHKIQDAASRYPNLEQIMGHCSSTAFEVIESLKAYPAFTAVGKTYSDLLLALVSDKNAILGIPEWTEFLDIIHKAVTNSIENNKILLPSALINVLMNNVEQLLSNTVMRKQLLELLQVCVVCESSPGNCFVADYALVVVKSILKFYRSLLKADTSGKENEEIVVNFDLEDKEAIHYISGSVVRAFYRKSKQFPKSNGWCNIGKVIVDKLLESDSVPGPPAIVKGWTIAKSRGKLFFVSGELFDFFMGVAEVIEKGSQVRVDREHVIEVVCQGCIILLWDEAVGDSLSEKASYDLMCGMIRSFCNTYGVGMSRKLMNNFRKNKAEASIPLRHKVAPKS